MKGGVTGAFVATWAVRAIGGPRRALLLAGPAFLAAGLAVAASPSLALLTVAFAVLGLCDGFVDTAMNQAGAALRQRVGVSVMGRLHASLAGATLVATGAGALVAGTTSPAVHLAAVLAGRLALDRAVDAAGWLVVARLSGVLAATATIAGLALGAATGEPVPLLVGLGLAAVGAIAAGAGLFLALGVTAVAGVMIAALAGALTRDHPR